MREDILIEQYENEMDEFLNRIKRVSSESMAAIDESVSIVKKWRTCSRNTGTNIKSPSLYADSLLRGYPQYRKLKNRLYVLETDDVAFGLYEKIDDVANKLLDGSNDIECDMDQLARVFQNPIFKQDVSIVNSYKE